MNTRLIRIGNSQGIILPKKLLQQYQLAGEVNLQPAPEGVLITPVIKLHRQGWDERFQHSVAQGQVPESELLEAFSDEAFEETEWQW
ncbi:AbrB/MazE/SpoVT family DNA-binding domain-containing protein [Hymenobacter sp. BT175]|uniref:AbrB/MazE/SpoVT family DNA-binding domain-containing protein n=1 Tax=Hymenobacter translucens TaxID=2886507 RepID=UPI001D0F320B|nr:AbrB/MazE/SpoVT family DNA-binding domain-containing protein [Hymenobacter translucens]MCC2548606.1 AbrB/MazE/SpoVT family DNA-binding domain-containing protein [Hymenobacter translucens]